ncbi:hypothetical protein K8R42_01150, partial [bacterium]|nr:hypothetical protein [bacterium]
IKNINIMQKIFQTWQKTKNNLKTSIFLVIGILLITSFVNQFIKLNELVNLLQKNIISDSLLAGLIGSLAAGNPITSYIISGELINSGISLAAVTAFILTWVTVGIVQLPAESMLLGKKFAIIRNILSFISAIFIALIVQFILVR